MQRACIAVVDASRARLFSFEQLDAPDAVRTQELRQHVELVTPQRRMRASELFTETRPPSGRAAQHRGFAVSDHRDEHLHDMDIKFAREIVAALVTLLDETGARRLMIAASPGMLGILRPLGAPLRSRVVELEELPRDLTRETSAQLHDHLAARGFLPARERLQRAAPAASAAR